MSPEAHDLVDRLLQEHQQIKEQFRLFEEAGDVEQPQAFLVLAETLRGHEAAESQVVYPALRRSAAGGQAVAVERMAEQSAAERLLDALCRTEISSPAFAPGLEELRRSVLEHAEAEEQTVFWVLRANLSAEDLRQLEEHYLDARQAPGPAEGDADILGLLATEHLRIDQLLRQLEQMGEAAPRSVLEEAVHELVAHGAAEAEVFYPALARVAGKEHDLVKDGHLDHEEMSRSLERIEKLSMDTAHFRAELSHLIAVTRAHVSQEEAEAFSLLRSSLDAVELDLLGRQLERARRHAPIRPHPHSPNSGTGAKLADRVAAVVDRLRTHRQVRP